MNKSLQLLLLSTAIALFQSCMDYNNSKQKVERGGSNSILCIPDSASAINFAKLKWEEKFGKQINERGPFTAKLINDSVWQVTSSVESIVNPKPNEYNFGGILSIQILKTDCKVLYLNVTK